MAVGIGGGGRHPKAKMTVKSLARIHQLGLGPIDQRQIIVMADGNT